MTFCVFWLETSPPLVDIDAHSEPIFLITVCSKGSVIAFYLSIGYLGSLALSSFSLAFLAGSLPDTCTEGKFLTLSMLVFPSTWITLLPVYNSS